MIVGNNAMIGAMTAVTAGMTAGIIAATAVMTAVMIVGMIVGMTAVMIAGTTAVKIIKKGCVMAYAGVRKICGIAGLPTRIIPATTGKATAPIAKASAGVTCKGIAPIAAGK
jgi:hypothetical protein